LLIRLKNISFFFYFGFSERRFQLGGLEIKINSTMSVIIGVFEFFIFNFIFVFVKTPEYKINKIIKDKLICFVYKNV
jgi:hypothetical protein